MSATAMLAAATVSPPPAGTWYQASDGTEIVLESKVRLTPSGNWGGTSLGGSAGYGSMTTTRVVVEPTSMRVARNMSLTIGGDGRFTWTTTRRFADPKGCMRSVRQSRNGTASMSDASITFTIQDGEERSEGCGSDARKPVVPGVERYSAVMAETTMTLTGTGGVRWQFRK